MIYEHIKEISQELYKQRQSGDTDIELIKKLNDAIDVALYIEERKKNERQRD